MVVSVEKGTIDAVFYSLLGYYGFVLLLQACSALTTSQKEDNEKRIETFRSFYFYNQSGTFLLRPVAHFFHMLMRWKVFYLIFMVILPFALFGASIALGEDLIALDNVEDLTVAFILLGFGFYFNILLSFFFTFSQALAFRTDNDKLFKYLPLEYTHSLFEHGLFFGTVSFVIAYFTLEGTTDEENTIALAGVLAFSFLISQNRLALEIIVGVLLLSGIGVIIPRFKIILMLALWSAFFGSFVLIGLVNNTLLFAVEGAVVIFVAFPFMAWMFNSKIEKHELAETDEDLAEDEGGNKHDKVLYSRGVLTSRNLDTATGLKHWIISRKTCIFNVTPATVQEARSEESLENTLLYVRFNFYHWFFLDGFFLACCVAQAKRTFKISNAGNRVLYTPPVGKSIIFTLRELETELIIICDGPGVLSAIAHAQLLNPKGVYAFCNKREHLLKLYSSTKTKPVENVTISFPNSTLLDSFQLNNIDSTKTENSYYQEFNAIEEMAVETKATVVAFGSAYFVEFMRTKIKKVDFLSAIVEENSILIEKQHYVDLDFST